MDDVVDLQAEREERTPHLSGEARCLACGHVEIVVAPAGVTWMECSKCSLMRSRFVGPALRDDEMHWECACHNKLFYVTVYGFYCPNCGLTQMGHIAPPPAAA